MLPTSIGGRKDGEKDGEPKTKPLHFSSKRRGTKHDWKIPKGDTQIYMYNGHYRLYYNNWMEYSIIPEGVKTSVTEYTLQNE